MFYFFFLVTFLSIQIVHGVTRINGSNGFYYQYHEDDEDAVLGKGSFGRAVIGWKYKGKYILAKVALKFELIRPNKTIYVYREARHYRKLAGHDSIPKYHDCVEDGKGYAVLIIELLGPSLRKFRKEFGKFTIARTMHIGIQILNVMEHLHEMRVAHNDLKPDNFAVGYNDSSKIYIFDFGMATIYKNDYLWVHAQKERADVGSGRGTGYYMSGYAHSHQVLSRRDDLESIAYMLIEFLNGILPWSHSSMKDMALMKRGWIMDENNEKRKFTYEERCGNICQETLMLFLKYARRMEFEEKPRYNYLRGLLEMELENRPLNMVKEFDSFLAASKKKK